MTEAKDVIAELQSLLDERAEYLELGIAMVDESVHAAIAYAKGLSKLPSIPDPQVTLKTDGSANLTWHQKGKGIVNLSFDLDGFCRFRAYSEGTGELKYRFSSKYKDRGEWLNNLFPLSIALLIRE